MTMALDRSFVGWALRLAPDPRASLVFGSGWLPDLLFAIDFGNGGIACGARKGRTSVLLPPVISIEMGEIGF